MIPTPTSEVERVLTCKFRDGNDLLALARKHAEDLEAVYAAIRAASSRFDNISWGWDGDCGTQDIISTLEDFLPENAPT